MPPRPSPKPSFVEHFDAMIEAGKVVRQMLDEEAKCSDLYFASGGNRVQMDASRARRAGLKRATALYEEAVAKFRGSQVHPAA